MPVHWSWIVVVCCTGAGAAADGDRVTSSATRKPARTSSTIPAATNPRCAAAQDSRFGEIMSAPRSLASETNAGERLGSGGSAAEQSEPGCLPGRGGARGDAHLRQQRRDVVVDGPLGD